MSNPRKLASLLLLGTAFCPAAAFAQPSQPSAPVESPPPGPAAASAGDEDAQPDEGQEQEVEISAPGADPGSRDIVVTGAIPSVVRRSPEVVSVLSAEDIARTGEGDIAGALSRVSGLSVVGSGFVYVRGLGDRYSLALLNGLALPSPEPLRRVVPLDLFPTSVLASAFVQKSYSANYPGEFGGGVINLTTSDIPEESFLTIGGSIGGDTFTTNNLGYDYYGSPTDWTGFDGGERSIPGPLREAFDRGAPISEGAAFTRQEIQNVTASLSNSRTSVVQRIDHIPANLGVDMSGGTSFGLGGARIGIIGSLGYSNSWLTRDALQQTQAGGGVGTEFRAVRTDNRIILNGLIGVAAELGEHEVRWTNLVIRDTLKTSRLAAGFDIQLSDPIPGGPAQQINQRTAWFERQLINTQIVGEFDFGAIDVDLRGGYANSRRDAPYERAFSYAYSPQVGDYVNTLNVNAQSASIAFSELDEDVWNFGGDVSWTVPSLPGVTIGAGAAWLDTLRVSTRRDFVFRPANALNLAVAQQRPDFLLSDFNVFNYDILLVETSALAGIARYQGDLEVLGLYGQVTADVTDALKINAGVRFEDGRQSVLLADLFNQGGLNQTPPIEERYLLPAATVTWTLADDMQLRLHGSKTLARPQFRELAPQVYFDTDSDRQFFGNPFLVDSRLTNFEARYEWYFARQQRFSIAGFFKRIDRPIEAVANIVGGGALVTTFANAPSANLYGVELEVQRYWPLASLGPYRLVTIGNYTYSTSEIRVRDGDTTTLNDTRGERPAIEVFRDGTPLTGQSRHLANFQLGIENTDRLQQATLLVNYASRRVTSRGPAGQADIFEEPGLRLDFVARQSIPLFGLTTEISFEARNLLGENYEEYQPIEGARIETNSYDVGRAFSFGLSVTF
jgi:outer membrane receptor protein involved in Fe transport